MPLAKRATPVQVVKKAQMIKGFDKRNKYLMEQARSFFKAKDFEGAIRVAKELTVGANKYTIEANVLIVKSEQALQVQQTLGAGNTEEAKKSLEASTDWLKTEEDTNRVDNSG